MKSILSMMAFYVYILKCADGTFYTGSTNDLKKRTHAHNHLKSGARYTSSRRPVKVVYKEKFPTFNEALRREYQMKQLKRKDKILLIAGKLNKK